jgi:hypothetical protein
MSTQQQNREYSRRYRILHPDRIRESKLRYKIAHPDKIQRSRRAYCASHRAELTAYARTYRAANLEKQRAQKRAYYATHRPHLLAARRSYHAEHRDQHHERDRRRHLRKMYGMTPEQYDALYATQEGKCAVCGRHQAILNVDHNHANGQVRHLLCGSCNLILGQVHDDIALLQSLIDYLQLHAARAARVGGEWAEAQELASP